MRPLCSQAAAAAAPKETPARACSDGKAVVQRNVLPRLDSNSTSTTDSSYIFPSRGAAAARPQIGSCGPLQPDPVVANYAPAVPKNSEPEPKQELEQVDGDTLIEAILGALLGGRVDAASGPILEGWLHNTGPGFARRLINDLVATPSADDSALAASQENFNVLALGALSQPHLLSPPSRDDGSPAVKMGFYYTKSDLAPADHTEGNFDAKDVLDMVACTVAREIRMAKDGYFAMPYPRRRFAGHKKWCEHMLLAEIERQGPHVYKNLLRAVMSLDYLQQACAAKRADGTPFSAEGLERLNEIKLDILLQARFATPLCVAGEE